MKLDPLKNVWRKLVVKWPVVSERVRKRVVHIVNTHFQGDYEKAGIALTVSIGVLLAVLILFMNKGSSGGEGHGHGGEEHGEEHGEETRAVELSEDAVKAAKIETEEASKQVIKPLVKMRGRITVNRDRAVSISPRYSGTVLRINKNLGDEVQKSETLAVLESVTSRASFDVRSGLTGTVVERHLVPGGYVSDKESIFSVVDLSSVWAELNAADTDFPALKAGQKIRVTDSETGFTAETTVMYVSPKVYEDTQSVVVRAVLANEERKWHPGSFIEAEVFSEEKPETIAVKVNAVQTLENKSVIFVKKEDSFEARQVALGNSDERLVEITKGIEEGEVYVSENSFVVKAELLKSTAEHEH